MLSVGAAIVWRLSHSTELTTASNLLAPAGGCQAADVADPKLLQLFDSPSDVKGGSEKLSTTHCMASSRCLRCRPQPLRETAVDFFQSHASLPENDSQRAVRSNLVLVQSPTFELVHDVAQFEKVSTSSIHR